MPLVVNKDEIKLQILKAYERLSRQKPLTEISLRDIAAEAGMSHTKVLRYFNNKNTLYVEGARWATDMMVNDVQQWFDTHSFRDYADERQYIDSLFDDVRCAGSGSISPRSIVMTCALAAYSEELKEVIQEAYSRLQSVFQSSLEAAFKRPLTQQEVYSVSIIFSGVFFSAANESMPYDSGVQILGALLK